MLKAELARRLPEVLSNTWLNISLAPPKSPALALATASTNICS
jgi:hypothetical protein